MNPWLRRGSLIAVLAIALWILIAYPDWVGIPVACVVIVLLALLTYVQADRDRLLRSNEVLRGQLDRAEHDATTHAGIAARSISLAADLTSQLDTYRHDATQQDAEPTPAEYADVRPQQSWWQQ